MKLLGTELTFNNNEIWHKGNLDPSIFRVKQNKYVTTTAGTVAYYRVATIPMSSIFKNTIFKVKAYTPTGTTTESTIIVDIAYYAGNYSSQTAAVSALTSHSYDSNTTAENGWVLRYCRVSFDADYGYIDLRVYKNSVVTIEIEPLVESDWIWATGSLTANPAVGSLKNVSITMAAGFRASNIVATSATSATTASLATSATYSNYGTRGTTTISNTTDKTGQWAYFGYFTISYNATYLRGHCANIRVRLQEINHDGTKNLADLDDFVLILKASMPYHANSTEFNTKVPSIHIEIEGKTSISPNDVAGLVYSTSTSTKTIRFYIRLKEANTVYQINPEQRYGRSFTTSSYSATTSYFYFTYAGTQTPVTSLPTPAQDSIAYAVKRTIDADTLNGKFAEDFALRNHTHTIANITNLQSALDSKAPLASPAFTGTPTAPTAPNGTNTTQIATTAFVQNALSTGGYGDMVKSVYDTNNDGSVDKADTINGIEEAGNLKYYGTDSSGNAGFFDLPIGILSGSPLPTPGVGYRGRIFILLGGIGIADVPYICLKKAEDVYVWQRLPIKINYNNGMTTSSNPSSYSTNSVNEAAGSFILLNSILTGSPLPIPDATYRGKIFVLFGGAGVADQPYICLKNADDTYAWHKMPIKITYNMG